MPRSLIIRKPTASEVRQVSKLLSTTDDLQQQRRADTILLYAAGLNASEVAAALEVHVNTVYADLHAFDKHGLACLKLCQPRGAPARISSKLLAAIQHLAELPPYEWGLPYGRWSLSKLAIYLRQQRLLKTISREHLRQLLKKGASPFGASSARSSVQTRSGRRS
jgi:transposase